MMLKAIGSTKATAVKAWLKVKATAVKAWIKIKATKVKVWINATKVNTDVLRFMVPSAR